VGAALLYFSGATGSGTLTMYNSGGGVIGSQATSGATISLLSGGAYFIVT
jgi:hypothetical protein